MVIMGIDPGTATTGYGIVEKQGNRLSYVTCGVIQTEKTAEMPDRLLAIYTQLNRLLDVHEPDVLVTERLFFSNNVTTALQVGRTIGIALLAAAQRGLPWVEYRPMEVKMAVVGYGAAEKKQVQYMVKQLLNLDKVPRPDDAADALAIAICHAHSSALTALQQLTR
ncbi:MAG TPA: crossover junction endodeoxyribonuclease RuvC [Chthonomonadaceae bacterium]|nr:crossover junction endodeoxyribonuclease RuvC [Chthonomonadaceae bacterium]